MAAATALSPNPATIANQSLTVDRPNRLIFKLDNIADNTATNILKVRIPNKSVSACLKLRLLSMNGGADIGESAVVAEYLVAVTRQAGGAAVAVISSLTTGTSPLIATTSGGATHTQAAAVGTMQPSSGGEAIENYCYLTATINDSGNLGSNYLVVDAELITSEPGVPSGISFERIQGAF